MSPILVRPVREQLEHDRVIRLLLVKLKRKHDVTANIGEDQSAAVKIGLLQIFPDLLLTSTDRGHKLMGTVEVETSESVNHLEARAQWAHLGKARAPFHLYVPAGSVDIARRLATENQVNVAEIWSYHTLGDQTRFTLVHRAPEPRRGDPKRPVGIAARVEITRPAVLVPPRPIETPRPEPVVAAVGSVRPGVTKSPRVVAPVRPAAPARPAAAKTVRPDKTVRPEKKVAARPASSGRSSAAVKKRVVAPEPRRGASSRAAAPARKSASAHGQKRK